MRYRHMGTKALKAAGFRATNGVTYLDIDGFPKSGSACQLIDSFGESVPFGSIVVDKNTGVAFVNEGTSASPYWTPVAFKQRGLLAWHTDFTDGTSGLLVDTSYVNHVLGVPIAITETQPLMSNGIQLHGTGMDSTDSGLTVAVSDQGAVGSLIAHAADANIAVISPGTGTTPAFQPDQNGTMVVDVNVAISSLTACAAFLGFCGSAAAALNPIMTYATTVISFAATIGDDVAGLAFSSELTDGDRWFAPHDKGNANASIATTATGVDTGVDLVAGTYQRLRVEVDADGAVRVFIAKALVSSFAAGTLDTDEEIHPMFYVETSTTATKTATLKSFGAWGKRA